jgi:5'-nucleotidase
MSGTIGAAIMATLNGFPSIAISAGMRFEEVGTTFPSTLQVFDAAADFTCSVIDSLRSSVGKSGRLLPKEVLLNINYPPLPKDQIKGVLHPKISAGNMIRMGYHRCDESGHVVPGFYPGVDPQQPQKEAGDVRAHMEGYITISTIKPRWNPPAKQARKLEKRLEALTLDFPG